MLADILIWWAEHFLKFKDFSKNTQPLAVVVVGLQLPLTDRQTDETESADFLNELHSTGLTFHSSSCNNDSGRMVALTTHIVLHDNTS